MNILIDINLLNFQFLRIKNNYKIKLLFFIGLIIYIIISLRADIFYVIFNDYLKISTFFIIISLITFIFSKENYLLYNNIIKTPAKYFVNNFLLIQIILFFYNFILILITIINSNNLWCINETINYFKLFLIFSVNSMFFTVLIFVSIFLFNKVKGIFFSSTILVLYIIKKILMGFYFIYKNLLFINGLNIFDRYIFRAFYEIDLLFIEIAKDNYSFIILLIKNFNLIFILFFICIFILKNKIDINVFKYEEK